VSDDGAVIVGYSGSRAVRWNANGSVEDLGTTGTTGARVAMAVNHDGTQIVGYSGLDSFIWRAGVGMTVVAPESQARGISASGLSVVGHMYSTSTAFLREGAGVVQSIVAGAGAEDVSDDGSVVVGWVQTDAGQRAFRWTPSADLGILPPLAGSVSAAAEATNGDGTIVVGSDNSPSGTRAFVWSEAIGSIDLYDYLALRGVNMSGWTRLRAATNVSANGRIVVGYGDFNGSTRAFVAEIGHLGPTPACVAADLTRSGTVDGADLGALLAFWGPRSQVFPQADIDGSGNIDGADLGVLLSYWGNCP
jgi:probable HAF family extracellular repeat protein